MPQSGLGNSENAGQRCHNNLIGGTGSICRPSLPEAKKRWVTTTGIQSETPEQICSVRTFQNGGDAHGFGFGAGRVLDDKNRSKGCIFLSENCSERPEVSEVSLEGQSVSVQVMPVWPSISPKIVHETAETSHGPTATQWYSGGHLSGRYHLDKWQPGDAEGTHRNDSLATGTPGVCCQLRQVSVGTSEADRIPGFHLRHSSHAGTTPSRESAEYQAEMHGNDEQYSCNRQGIGKVVGETDIHCEGYFARTSALQTTSNAENKSIVTGGSELRSSGGANQGVQGRTCLVDRQPGKLEWPYYDKGQPRPGDAYQNRCLKTRLGCSEPGHEYSGSLVRPGETGAHQPIGVESSILCPKGIHQGHDKHPSAPQGRQQSDSGSDQQDGGPQVGDTSGSDAQHMGVLFVEIYNVNGRAHPRGVQPGSGLSESHIHGFQQLEVDALHDRGNQQPVGAPGSGLVCRSTECSDWEVCQLETGSRGMADGCLHNEMGQHHGVCIPTVLYDRQMFSQDNTGTGGAGHNNTSVADTTMVSQSFDNAGGQPSVAATDSSSIDLADRQQSSIDAKRTAMSSGMAGLRETWQAAGLSEQAARVMENARRPGTQSAYNSPWGKWVAWCGPRKISPFQASVADITNFLADMIENGMEYSTLNVYRSALSAYHPEIQGHKVGQHPLVVQFMKGAFNMNPPKPRYSTTWSVDKVLNHIKDMGQNELLSLKLLTMKLAMLMALTSAGRAQELHCLDPTLMQDHGHQVVFPLGKLTKALRPSKPQIELKFMQFEADPHLDVVACLRHYLQVTNPFRDSPEKRKHLFLGFSTPHNPVVTCTISRWLKELMSAAGIDTSVYIGHSVRGAATSKAKTLGLSSAQIIARANWSRVETFHKFYYKGTSDEFQNKVLLL